MVHIFIINIWTQAARPMFSGFQSKPKRIAVFDTAVGGELRLVGRVDYLRKHEETLNTSSFHERF